jgi:hypothetical protein
MIEFVDHTEADAAGEAAGDMIRAFIKANPNDATCQYLSGQIHIAGIVSTDLAGLVIIGGLVLLQNRIPGAAKVISDAGAFGGSNVEA